MVVLHFGSYYSVLFEIWLVIILMSACVKLYRVNVEGTQRFIFSYIHQNVYSEVPSKKHRKAFASKLKISYQNKDFTKSNVYDVILSQIRLQPLN